jgi:hypothetical protein
MIRSIARRLALAALGLSVPALPALLASPSSAETRLIPDSLTRPAVELGAEGLAPAHLRVATDAAFALRNRSDALARVEFKLRRGEGLRCAVDPAAPARGRRFLVDGGDTLVCTGKPGDYRYTVYRTLAGQHRRSEGRVEIEAP